MPPKFFQATPTPAERAEMISYNSEKLLSDIIKANQANDTLLTVVGEQLFSFFTKKLPIKSSEGQPTLGKTFTSAVLAGKREAINGKEMKAALVRSLSKFVSDETDNHALADWIIGEINKILKDGGISLLLIRSFLIDISSDSIKEFNKKSAQRDAKKELQCIVWMTYLRLQLLIELQVTKTMEVQDSELYQLKGCIRVFNDLSPHILSIEEKLSVDDEPFMALLAAAKPALSKICVPTSLTESPNDEERNEQLRSQVQALLAKACYLTDEDRVTGYFYLTSLIQNIKSLIQAGATWVSQEADPQQKDLTDVINTISNTQVRRTALFGIVEAQESVLQAVGVKTHRHS